MSKIIKLPKTCQRVIFQAYRESSKFRAFPGRGFSNVHFLIVVSILIDNLGLRRLLISLSLICYCFISTSIFITFYYYILVVKNVMEFFFQNSFIITSYFLNQLSMNLFVVKLAHNCNKDLKTNHYSRIVVYFSLEWSYNLDWLFCWTRG